MKFELTILGSGSAVPTIRRNPTAHVLNIQEGYFLIDCGEGTQMQMRRYGVRMQRINHIFISHIHGDHFLGLSGYLQTLHLLGRTIPMHIYGPPPLKHLILDQFKAVNATLRYELVFHETQDREMACLLETPKVRISSFPLKHKVPTTGFLVEEMPKNRKYLPEEGAKVDVPHYRIQAIKEGADFIRPDGTVIPNGQLTEAPVPPRSYAYCSDTCYYEPVIQYVRGVDLLYHEASFLEDRRDRAVATMHSTASDAAKIAHKAGVKRLLLGHFSARYTKDEPFLAEACPIFSRTELASDGLVITL